MCLKVQLKQNDDHTNIICITLQIIWIYSLVWKGPLWSWSYGSYELQLSMQWVPITTMMFVWSSFCFNCTFKHMVVMSNSCFCMANFFPIFLRGIKMFSSLLQRFRISSWWVISTFSFQINRFRQCKPLWSWSYGSYELQLAMQWVPITTNVVSSNPIHGEVYSIQHYVIKFVSDLRQVGGFLLALQFPPIKLTATV
jgi:hypothetical protein